MSSLGLNKQPTQGQFYTSSNTTDQQASTVRTSTPGPDQVVFFSPGVYVHQLATLNSERMIS